MKYLCHFFLSFLKLLVRPTLYHPGPSLTVQTQTPFFVHPICSLNGRVTMLNPSVKARPYRKSGLGAEHNAKYFYRGDFDQKDRPHFQKVGLAFKFSCEGSTVKTQRKYHPDGDSSVRSENVMILVKLVFMSC